MLLRIIRGSRWIAKSHIRSGQPDPGPVRGIRAKGPGWAGSAELINGYYLQDSKSRNIES